MSAATGDADYGAWLGWQMRRIPVRGCGRRHIGVCDAERAERWSKPGAWIPPEYREVPGE